MCHHYEREQLTTATAERAEHEDEDPEAERLVADD